MISIYDKTMLKDEKKELDDKLKDAFLYIASHKKSADEVENANDDISKIKQQLHFFKSKIKKISKNHKNMLKIMKNVEVKA